jgi:hypothetical protein
MRSHRALPFVGSALVLLLLTFAQQGASQTSADFVSVKGTDERFRLDLGGFFQQFTTTIRLDSEKYGRGTEVSLEDDLGISANQANFRADGYWRFGRHGRVDFAYTGWNRSASHTLDTPIKVGDTTYDAHATLDSRLRVSLVELYYGYSFWNTPKFEAGLMLGFSALFNSVNVEGEATITGPDGTKTTGPRTAQSRSLTAPLPAIGAQVRYTIIPGLLVSGKIRGMQLTIDNVKGSVLEGRAGLDYYPWKNFGFGAAYDFMEIKIEKQTDPGLSLDYKYSGPMVYISMVF